MKKQLSVMLAAASLLLTLNARAVLVHETFATDPSLDGWQGFGNTNLFAWDPTNQVLDVTWDTTQPNSYYYYPLGVTLTTNDSYCVQFDLTLSNITCTGYQQQIAVGLLHWSEATNTAFSRTAGISPNVLEFDYFPADDYGDPASDDATVFDAADSLRFVYDNQTFNPGVTYHVVLLHYANSLMAGATIHTNGQVMSTLPEVYLQSSPGDDGSLVLDTLSVSSYADAGWGDIYAQGTIANLSFQTPLPVQNVQQRAAGQVAFASVTNWVYTLEQTADFQTWTPAGAPVWGNGTNLLLQATNRPAAAFYQVRADLP